MTTTIDRHETFPNVIRAWGEGLFGDGADPRGRLRDAVTHHHDLPVKAGTHHVWVVIVAGAPTAGANNAGTVAASHGEIWVGHPTTPSIVEDVSTLVHEIGHGWLVPNPLQFMVDGHVVEADRRDWIENNGNRSYSGPLLVGRECSHWGGYFWADHSPMDGLTFQRLPQEDGFDRWKQVTNARLPVKTADLPPIILDWNKFNDLDLAIMGVLDPQAAYASEQGRMSWIEPKLTAPLGFRAGVFVALSVGIVVPDSPHRIANDFLFFGMSNDHRRLAIERSDGTVLAEVQLGAAYHPLGAGNHSLALRVVRRGSALRFQARLDRSTVAPAGFGDAPTVGPVADYPGVPGLFDDLETTSQGQDFTHWQTVGTVQSASSPAFVGLNTAHTTGGPPMGFVEAIYFGLETMTTPGGHSVHRFDKVPPVIRSWSDLQPGIPVVHMPPRGPVLETGHGRLLMRLPIDLPNRQDADPCFGPPDPGETRPPYDHGPFRDQTAKVVLPAPHTDFAFGTSVRIQRTLFQRSSGGALNSIICGRERSMPVAGLIMSPKMRKQIIPDHICRVAYFIVAKTKDEITTAMLGHVETVRRYVDSAFSAATGGRLSLSSRLHWRA